MVLILPEHSQRPYRYGMTLLCVGAMFNWLGLADNNAEPVRYIGVTLIAAGALLICLAMCFWMKATHDPQVAMVQAEGDNVHHIVTIHNNDSILEKPPDYEAVTGSLPPSYEDAIKLNPIHLLLADSNQVGVLKSEPNNASQSEGQSTSILCQVHRSVDDTDSKPDDENKIIATTSVSALTTSSNSESTSQSTDNFGIRVLRLSRKFLGRTKSVQHDTEAIERTTRDVFVSNEVHNLDTSVR